MTVGRVDVDELANLMGPNQTPQLEQVNLKRKLDLQSDSEEDEVPIEPATEWEAMDTNLHPRPEASGGQGRFTREECAPTYIGPQNAISVIEVPTTKKIKTERAAANGNR